MSEEKSTTPEDELDALNARLQRRRLEAGVAVPDISTASTVMGDAASGLNDDQVLAEEIARHQARLSDARRYAGASLSMPGALAADLGRITSRLVALTAADAEARKSAVAMAAARARRAELVDSATLRGIPGDDVFVAAVNDAAPLTPALRTMLRGARWRADRYESTGRRPGHLLIVNGGTGNGKTVAAAWMTVRYPGTALFVTAAQIGETPYSRWGEFAAARERWRTVGMLVIDDVGEERGEIARRVVAERVGPLIFSRLNAGLETIISTNMTSSLFKAEFLHSNDTIVGREGEGSRETAGQSGMERLASRLRQQKVRGAPYWVSLSNSVDYRTEEGRSLLAALPRAGEDELKVFARL